MSLDISLRSKACREKLAEVVVPNSIIVMLAAAAFNFKRVMNTFLHLILEWFRSLGFGRKEGTCQPNPTFVVTVVYQRWLDYI